MATEEGGNVFTRKIGPLPGWAWVGIGVAGLYVYLSRKSASSSSSTSGTASTGVGVSASGSPQQGDVYSQSESDQALASLISALTYQIGAGSGSVSPGNSGGVATSPGNTGNPGIQPQPTSAQAIAQLPSVDSGDFPVIGNANTPYIPIGSVTAPGQYSGQNIGGGAPIYALQPGSNTPAQDFNWASLPVGTVIETPSQFQQYIAPGTVTYSPGK